MDDMYDYKHLTTFHYFVMLLIKCSLCVSQWYTVGSARVLKYTNLQSKIAVYAYLKSRQILHFGVARRGNI